MTYAAIKKDIKQSMRKSRSCCAPGYAALLRADDAEALARVCIKYWAELNHSLWPQFQQLLQKHYADVRPTLNAYGIFYNESSDVGLCVVDAHAGVQLTFGRNVSVVAHDDAFVLLKDSARATLLDRAQAIASQTTVVDARDYSFVSASGSARIRAFDASHVESDGSTTIYLSDAATLTNTRSHRVFR